MTTTTSKTIEAIEPDRRQKGVVRVVIDGRTILSLPDDLVLREQLTVGAEITPERLERLVGAVDREAAYRTALRALERRSFAKRDLHRRLVLKGHLPELAAAAVERAEAAGYLDDAKFARQYVASRSARGRGPARLRRELAHAGVARELIDAALTELSLSDPEVQREQIETIIARKRPQLEGLPPYQVRRRLLAVLARRGYTGSEVQELVRRIC